MSRVWVVFLMWLVLAQLFPAEAAKQSQGFIVKDITLEDRRHDLLHDQVSNKLNGMTKIAEYIITNDNTDRTLDADSTSTAELADVISTLIKDLINAQVLK